MIQLFRHDTILGSFSSLLILILTVFPLFSELAAATTLESNDMTIATFPARVGRFGQQVTVRAHIPDEAQVKKVTLVVVDGEKPLRGPMPRVQQAGTVPVIVKAKKQIPVRTGPAANKSIKAAMEPGETMQVAGEKDGYYRGVSASGAKGYVYKSDVKIISTGHAYAVTLPSAITSRSELVYTIEVTDIYGNITHTDPVSMRLLTNEEIDMFMAMYGGGAPTQGAPLYKKPLFWASMVAVAGGAYILTSDDNEEKTTPVNVLIEWE
jgi:hypothetical protein